jgi:hypothetical protein
MFGTVFALLYVAHHLADYPLQTDHQAAHKAAKSAAGWRANLTHAATHTVLCGIALAAAAGLGENVAWWAAAGAATWIGASHSLIDRRWPIRWWMEHTGQTEFAKHGGAAHIDQTAHILALAVAAGAVTAAA